MFDCYAATVEKIGEDIYRIYLVNSLDKGGDTEILISGKITIFKERVIKSNGTLKSAGFEPIKL